MQEIIIDIDAQGNSRHEGKNIEGKECDALMKAIEEAMGEEASRELKPEYHRPARTARRTVGK